MFSHFVFIFHLCIHPALEGEFYRNPCQECPQGPPDPPLPLLHVPANDIMAHPKNSTNLTSKGQELHCTAAPSLHPPPAAAPLHEPCASVLGLPDHQSTGTQKQQWVTAAVTESIFAAAKHRERTAVQCRRTRTCPTAQDRRSEGTSGVTQAKLPSKEGVQCFGLPLSKCSQRRIKGE